MPIDGIELTAQSLFFWAKPYWRYCVTAIWRFYWALVLDKEPLPEDVATVAALYYETNDFLSAAQKLNQELGKSWHIDEEIIQKENFPFKPDQTIEPKTLEFLCDAAADLIDLYKQENLPSVCLAHHKVHWAGCPVCEKNKEEN